MKKFILLCNFILIGFIVKSQESIGWYHLLKGSKTRILNNWVDNNKQDVWYAVDEILLVFEIKGTTGFAIDVDGRIVQILDMGLTKKITTQGRVVKMTKEIDVSLNKKFSSNNNVWLVGFNSANNTAKILLSNDDIVEIPKNSYIELSQYYLNTNKGYPVRQTAE